MEVNAGNWISSYLCDSGKNVRCTTISKKTEKLLTDATGIDKYIRRAQVKVGLINLCKGLFSLNARIYYKLKSGT